MNRASRIGWDFVFRLDGIVKSVDLRNVITVFVENIDVIVSPEKDTRVFVYR